MCVCVCVCVCVHPYRYIQDATNMSKANVAKYKKKQRLTNIALPNDLTMKPVWVFAQRLGGEREKRGRGREGRQGGREGERNQSEVIGGNSCGLPCASTCACGCIGECV